MTSTLGNPAGALVADAADLLARYPADSPEQRFEASSWAALLRTLGPALLTRACAPSHLTASAIVLDPAAGQTCLVLHGRIGLWVQPGGHLEDGDPTLAAAAAREAGEETGLTGRLLAEPVLLSRHRAPCRPGLVDWHLDVQFALISEHRPPEVSPESRDVAWWPVESLPDLEADGQLAPGVRESVDRARSAVQGQASA
jgi:8-oxo-dGTP pyrophosphatase MutT (NUDIX family)